MKKIRSNLWLIIAVVIAVVLLLWWLFIGTTLEEDADPATMPVGAYAEGLESFVSPEASLFEVPVGYASDRNAAGGGTEDL